MTMTDAQYRAFLDLLMCCDPWSVDPPEGSQYILEEYANEQAEQRGYANWIVAYHDMPYPEPRR